jgi:hypothetical protein
VFLEAAKAFDTVWVDGLLYRLTVLNLPSYILRNPAECMDISLLCCQVEVSVTGRSLVQSSPTDCGVPLFVIK